MSPQQKKIEKALKAIIADLRADLAAKDINANGSLSKSLRSETSFSRGDIYGLEYFSNIVFGREASEVTESYPELLQNLLEWVQAPKFNGMSLPDKQKLAFVAARNIIQRGTRRGRDPKYPGLAAQAIFDKHIEKLKPEILGGIRAKFVEGMRKG